jgi:hypothetical protein
MGPALWLVVRVGSRRIPLPLILLLPALLLLDLLALFIMLPLGLHRRQRLLVAIGSGFCLTRVALGLMLFGGGLLVRVRDDADAVVVEVRGSQMP